MLEAPMRGKDYQLKATPAADEPVEVDHRGKFEIQLCRRDYLLISDHYPDILDTIERAIADGVQPAEIKRWAGGVVNEPTIVQRCFNAARFIKAQE